MKKNQNGFILLIVFGMLSLCVIVATLFITKSTNYRKIISIFYNQAQVDTLIINGLEISKNILYFENTEKKSEPNKNKNKNTNSKKKTESKEKLSGIEKYNYKIIESLYSKKKFEIAPNKIIELQLFSENSKLNLNLLYNFEKHEFLNENSEKCCKFIFEKISKITGKKNLFPALSDEFKKRKYFLNDVTELLNIKEFAEVFKANIFYTPKEKENPTTLYLTDIFTCATESNEISPLFLSHSLRKILDIQDFKPDEFEKIKKIIKNSAAEITNLNEEKLKKLFKEIYKKDYDKIDIAFKNIFAKQLNFSIFSVLIKANFENNQNYSYAIAKQRKVGKIITYDFIRIYNI